RERKDRLRLGARLVWPASLLIKVREVESGLGEVRIGLDGSKQIALNLVALPYQKQPQRTRSAIQQHPHHMVGAGMARVQRQCAQEMFLKIRYDRGGHFPKRQEVHHIPPVRREQEMGIGAPLLEA